MAKKTAAIYSLIVGLSMVGMWVMFYISGSIPELETEPARIAMHLTAEFATALALIFAGWGLLAGKRWGYPVYLLATGALLYTMIQSPGYFIQSGDSGFVVMFAVLTLLAVTILLNTMRAAPAGD